MTSIHRVSFVTLFAAAFAFAQTPTHAKPKAPSQAELMTQPIHVSGGVIRMADPMDWETQGGTANTYWWNGTSLTTSSGIATGQGGTANTYWWNGAGWVLNDHTAGVETRPLDDKGPTLIQVEYSAVPMDQAKLAPASYLKLAKEIKFDSASTDEAQILQTIYSDHLRVYEFDKVDNYLYRQALQMGTRMRWVWKPMRQLDLDTLATKSLIYPPRTNGIVAAKLYGQRIPERILADVKCVLDQIPDALFLVSDFEAVKPDPFLAITTPKLLAEGKLWIVDRWDEPGFEDGKGKTGGDSGGKGGGDVVRNLGEGRSGEIAALVH